ncbi:MAG: AAA domain-containing protein [Bradymonadia bacterium]
MLSDSSEAQGLSACLTAAPWGRTLTPMNAADHSRISPRYWLSPSQVGRYFFHECDRHLRYLATPESRALDEGIPLIETASMASEALVQGGYTWEHRVLTERLGDRVHIADGDGPLHDRRYGFKETLKKLAELDRNEYLFQPTLIPPAGFLTRYGLPTELVGLRVCRPDLIGRDESGRLRLVDIKASEMLKASHRVQIAIYALLLQAICDAHDIDREVDLQEGSVWLYGAVAPETFDLAMTIATVEDFLGGSLAELLQTPAPDSRWHLDYRCEWCPYYANCRQQAEEGASVSLLPYLSTGARQFLWDGAWEGGTPVHTLDELHDVLADRKNTPTLERFSAFKGRLGQLRRAVHALRAGQVVLQARSTPIMPRGENVRVVLTLQRDPLSGRIFAAGVRRMFGYKVYGNHSADHLEVAASEEQCDAVRHGFIQALHRELEGLHDYNHGREWRDQLGLQTYVYDSYEQSLLFECLMEALEHDPPDIRRKALDLLLLYQSARCAQAEEHPQDVVAFPVVVLTTVIRSIFALPIPVALPLGPVSEVLQPNRYPSVYAGHPTLCFELSNAMRTDALIEAWRDPETGAPMLADEALIDEIRGDLHARLRAAGSLVDGIRDRARAQLFAWPPKFSLPSPSPFRDELLSRIAFVVRYESFIGALEVRQSRTAPLKERLRAGESLALEYLGDQRYRLLYPVELALFSISDFPDRLLVVEGEAGERAQMAYDDYDCRSRMGSPKGGMIWLAAAVQVLDEQGGYVREIKVRPNRIKDDPRLPEEGQRYLLHHRYTDFTSDKLINHLMDLDTTPEAPFNALIRDPQAFAGDVVMPKAVRETLKDELSGDAAGALTPSQQAAFEQVAHRRLSLIWGPPGTGKTYFLARAILSLVSAYRRAGFTLRVGVTAFTHTAVENLLAEIRALSQDDPDAPEVLKLKAITSPRGCGLKVLPENRTIKVEGPAVFGGTVYSLYKAAKKNLPPLDVLVVDEGSQLKLAETALSLESLSEALKLSAGRLVIAGDHLQLPPIIKGSYPPPEEEESGLEDSVFSYLYHRDSEEAPYTRQLYENWRMNDVLSQFSAQTLYGDAYQPARAEIAERRLELLPAAPSAPEGPEGLMADLATWLLDPEYPMALCVLEGVLAAAENPVEAALVAAVSDALRRRLILDGDGPLPDTPQGDEHFWRKGLFVVSPHHVQIRAIYKALQERREWLANPFVDTVDKMQGQQAEAVIVSYGVSDVETAAQEAAFIYSLNRLNVSVTRARAKCVVCLPRPLLKPTLPVLTHPDAAEGLGHMHQLTRFVSEGEQRRIALSDLGLGQGALMAWRL